jgi:hypothetical protein
VNNLAYATGLACGGRHGLSDRSSFIARIREGGIAAMELVARELKAMGLYRRARFPMPASNMTSSNTR